MYNKRIKILENIIQNHIQECKCNQRKSYLRTKLYGYQAILKNFIGDNVLELGSDGTATSSILVRWSKKLTIVDLEDKFSVQVDTDKNLKEAIFIKEKWENYKPKELYSDILLTDSLEHVENPSELLSIIKSWLSENGKLHIIVPNALSVHRQIGVEMDMLETPYTLNKNDIDSGHLRVYDFTLLKQHIKDSKLNLYSITGIQFKPNTDLQLANLPTEFSDSLNNLSYLFNEYCAEIYACCTK